MSLSLQSEFPCGPYMDLYDLVIDKDSIYRKIKTMFDFEPLLRELNQKYNIKIGRTAIPPYQLMMLLLLKEIYQISDRGLIDRLRTDLGFKYLLGMAPECIKLPDPSTISRFRRERLVDIDIVDLMIQITTDAAVQNELIKITGRVIVDSTHTRARYKQQAPKQRLMVARTKIRRALHEQGHDFEEFDKANPKPESEDYEEEKAYTEKLIEHVKENCDIENNPVLKETTEYATEIMKDVESGKNVGGDPDAKTGYKKADDPFFGYKEHVAIDESGIIRGAVVTSGEANDGKNLEKLIKDVVRNGFWANEIVGDGAYCSPEIQDFCNLHAIKLFSKMNESAFHVEKRNNADGFLFNKDAKMYVCPQGHLAIRKQKVNERIRVRDGVVKTESPRIVYFFDVAKCKNCPLKGKCYKGGGSKSYSVTIIPERRLEWKKYEETKEFKEAYSCRYAIEAKFGDMKRYHGFRVAESIGLSGMKIQTAFTIAAVNIKRILKLEKIAKNGNQGRNVPV